VTIGGPRLAHLGVEDMLGTAKPISETSTKLLCGNPLKGSGSSHLGPRTTQEPSTRSERDLWNVSALSSQQGHPGFHSGSTDS
jgi:hypothetical protein